MARSHPPTLLTVAERTLREECGDLRGVLLVAAVSGGGDSQALLHVLARLKGRVGFELCAHGVDHGLRAAAAAELDAAGALAARLGVPFSRTSLALAPGGNLQARAREARYAALRQVATDHAQGSRAALIATAHHADDRAETVLLRLLRGAGPAGLAVLEPRSADLVRPLVRARKSDVALHLARHELAFSDDPSNLDRTFLRVRVRRELLPLLQDLSAGVVDHLNALADALREAEKPELEGAPPLNRSQIRQVERAVRLGRPLRVRVSGGRDVILPRRPIKP